jgi:hypothetical protein
MTSASKNALTRCTIVLQEHNLQPLSCDCLPKIAFAPLTLRFAILRATEGFGEACVIPINVYADALIALLITASPRPETPEEIERLTALFRQRLASAMARRGVAGNA